MPEDLESGLTPEDPYQRRRELNRQLKRAFPDSDSAGMRIEMEDLRQQLEQAEARADACQLQAQIWKQEARAQSSTVAEIYQELTGKTGEPGDWNGVQPLKPAILRKQAEAVEHSATIFPGRDFTDIRCDLHNEASRLRQQADELEQEAGQ